MARPNLDKIETLVKAFNHDDMKGHNMVLRLWQAADLLLAYVKELEAELRITGAVAEAVMPRAAGWPG